MNTQPARNPRRNDRTRKREYDVDTFDQLRLEGLTVILQFTGPCGGGGNAIRLTYADMGRVIASYLDARVNDEDNHADTPAEAAQ